MKRISLLADLPQPFEGEPGFVAGLRSASEYHFKAGRGCDPGLNRDCLASGYDLQAGLPADWVHLETALASLEGLLEAKGAAPRAGGWLISLGQAPELQSEEFDLHIDAAGARLLAADQEGMRRAIYLLEEQLRAADGAAAMPGHWRRRPCVRQRISRCFFGPTYREPFFIDELSNDIDYYPEAYLDKLAHEGVNGLWLTMYFHDLPSSIFPGRGAGAEKRFAKLRQTVRRCARYGIRIYVFFSEPKLFASASYAVPLEEAAGHAELVGGSHGDWSFFCTSSQTGQKYLRESVEQLFAAVPELGGMINIMYGEDNGSCVAHMLSDPPICDCQLCARREPGEIFAQSAELMCAAMKKHSPQAEFIGWFYAPGQRDGSARSRQLAEVAAHWPQDCALMFNFESGGYVEQLGKRRVVFDYSLAYLGPSELFRQVAGQCDKAAAKLQVGCSHENASIPFMPVPSNLYEKYKLLHEFKVDAVMQCWYFGNYPGLMNRAAGLLSFEPFPAVEDDFLLELARPDWGRFAPEAALAWRDFAAGYRHFPANLAFEWYGPLHHCIVWPWHLFPVDQPISPSWVVKNFPETSGDRIGECLAYHHDLNEGLQLCQKMSRLWQRGCERLAALRSEFENAPERLADIDLAEAIGLQMKSAANLLQFYAWREEMLHEKVDRLEQMRRLVMQEMENTREMRQLCLRDPRLGYHSEAEAYLFFPEKLALRLELLQALLEQDFPRFDLEAPWVDAYNGLKPQGKLAWAATNLEKAEKQEIAAVPGAAWKAALIGEELHIACQGLQGKQFCIELEPCRLWPPLRIDFDAEGRPGCYEGGFRNVPELRYEQSAQGMLSIIPLSLFEGFRKPGFPMRFNLRGSGFAWVEGEDFPHRLMHRDYNPVKAGWLILGEDTKTH